LQFSIGERILRKPDCQLAAQPEPFILQAQIGEVGVQSFFVRVSGSIHGEVGLMGGQCVGGVPCPGFSTGYIADTVEYCGNFITWDQTAEADNTSTFYASTGAVSFYRTNHLKVCNNVIVTNKATNGHSNIRDAMLRIGWAVAGDVQIYGNYVATSGVIGCMLNGAMGAITQFASSQDDGTGAHNLGNILTVTAFPSSGWVGTTGVQTGMTVMHPGSTSETILSCGTATSSNGIGTYTRERRASEVDIRHDDDDHAHHHILYAPSSGPDANVNLHDRSFITASLPSLGAPVTSRHEPIILTHRARHR
jgi:hypothetical protein